MIMISVLVVNYTSTIISIIQCKCKNLTDTILWQGHHDRVMQLD